MCRRRLMANGSLSDAARNQNVETHLQVEEQTGSGLIKSQSGPSSTGAKHSCKRERESSTKVYMHVTLCTLVQRHLSVLGCKHTDIQW